MKHVTGVGNKTNCSIKKNNKKKKCKKKEVEGLKWSEGMSQSDLGKMVVESFSNLCLNMRGTRMSLI